MIVSSQRTRKRFLLNDVKIGIKVQECCKPYLSFGKQVREIFPVPQRILQKRFPVLPGNVSRTTGKRFLYYRETFPVRLENIEPVRGSRTTANRFLYNREIFASSIFHGRTGNVSR
jgi:hypothetical protein